MSFSRPRRGREDEEGAGGDADQRESTPGKRPRHCSCSCCKEREDFYESQFEILKKEMQSMSKGFTENVKIQREMQEFYLNSQLQSEKKICEIREQLNTFISELSTPGDKHLRNYSSLRTMPNKNQTRTYRLKFENKCGNVKYSRRHITADDGSPIKVAIYDHDNRIITDGPLSSMQVEIVVLNGQFNNDNKEQWSRGSFCRNIIEGRPGKPNLFPDKLFLRLEHGVAILNGAKFQDNSSFVPSKKFRMGVRAADDSIPESISEKIMEGISESFKVKDGRGFPKKKVPHPSLSDPIYKLKQIAENGNRHKLLEKMQIKLVQDFVRFYDEDKDGLRKAFGNISDHDWEIIVEHALSCKPEFSGKCSSYEELDDAQKGLVEASKMEAYDNLVFVQHEDKKHCYEHEVIAGDGGSFYLRGSCSNVPLPTLTTTFHDEMSQQEKQGLESGPAAKESPRALHRWVKVVMMVTTVHFWNKKQPSTESSKPCTESSFGVTDILDNFQVETDIFASLGDIFPDNMDYRF